MKAHLTLRAGAVFALTLALIGIAAPTGASAADGDTTPAIVQPGLVPCVGKAAKMKASAWICTAEGLSITVDLHGKTVDRFIPLKSTDYNAAPATPTAAPETLSTMAVGDDYDYWCETGTICHRNPSPYSEETKGNAAYGDGSGALGSYDAIIRTNLNGRQAQWDVTIIWDSGPSLAFSSTYVQCIEDSTFPVICGTHDLSNYTLTSSSFRHAYPRIYGNKLNNADKYHGAFHTHFTPSGYGIYNASTLSTGRFTCPSGTGNCFFF